MEVLKPSANMGARVDGGASGATSLLTLGKEADHEKKYHSLHRRSNILRIYSHRAS
jgi:hypothetical protein